MVLDRLWAKLQPLLDVGEVVGRLLFTFIFISSAPKHLGGETVQMVADKGLPLAEVAVPFGGLLAGLGSILIILGWQTRLGALMICGFLLPVTLMMHNWWAFPADQQGSQYIGFIKNFALFGAALFIAARGAGPLSLDARAAAKEEPLG